MKNLKKISVRLSFALCLSLAGILSTSESTFAQTLTAKQVLDLINQCEAKRDQYDFRAALPLCLNAAEAAEKLGNPNYLSVIYTDLGNEHYDLGNYQKAIEFHTKALQIDIQIGDKKGEGADYGNLGNAYDSIGDYQKAIEFHNKHLKIALEIGDKKGEGNAYGNLGIAYDSLGDYQKAIEFHNKRLKIALEIGDKKGEGNAYSNLGSAYQSLGDYRKVIEFHNKRLKIALETGDKQGEGAAYGNLGNAYYSLGNYPKAIEFQNKSLKIALEIGDKQGEGNVYSNLGIAYYSLGDYSKAIEFYNKALQIAIQIGDKKMEGAAYGNLGNASQSLGDYQKAIEFHSKRLKIALEIADRQGEGNAYGNLGIAYYLLGDYQKAIEFYSKQLKIVTQIGDKRGEGNAYGNLGNAYQSLGDYQKAVEFHNKALRVDIQISSKLGEGQDYGNLGITYYLLGDYQKAIKFHNKRLKIALEIADKQGEGNAYGNLGNAYQSLGDYQKAVEFHTKALQIDIQIGDKKGEGADYGNLGNAYQSLGDYQKAIEFQNKQLEVVLQIGDKQGEGNAYGNLGNAYEKLKQYGEALLNQQKAITTYSAIGANQDLYYAQWAIARILIAQEKPDLAILFYKQAVNTIQSTKERIKDLDPALKKSFGASKSSVYRQLADLLLKQGRVLEAQKVLGLLKEQETVEYLRSTSQKSGGEAQLSDEEKKIWTNYQSLIGQDLQLYQQRDKIIAQIKLIPIAEREQSTDYQKLTQARDAVQQKISLQIKGFDVFLKKAAASMKSLDSSRTVENLQDDVTKYSRLLAKDKAALISPLVLPDRLELILLTPKAKPIQRTVKVTKVELDKLILRLRQNLANPGTETRSDLQQLYTWLVAPFDAEIQQLVKDKTIDTLVFAPDDNLRLIPMAALYDGKQYLVEKMSVGTIDRISALANRSTPQSQMLAMGLSKAQNNFPPLSSVPEEVKNIGKLYDSPVLLDERFTKANIQENLNGDQSVILHMATHGSFGINKDNTFILLFNGKLSLDDLKALELRNVSLLTFSACETAANDGRSGKGLAAAAEASGAQSVLGSLWSVNDASTSQLMQQFYTNLKAGMPKAEALRQAQLTLIQGQQSANGQINNRGGLGVVSNGKTIGTATTAATFSDPFYWAPFILIGDWR
jgi:CHAT domain-containing protein/Flp pilus assembly protein TadD